MTVEELIGMLKKLDRNKEIVIEVDKEVMYVEIIKEIVELNIEDGTVNGKDIYSLVIGN